MKAMILAAGRGDRLRPLTDTLPKPLIRVRDKSLIVRHLERLAEAGVSEVVINVSYLASQIVDALGDGATWGLNIDWSHEDQPLETAGGLATARPLLGKEPFLVVNADVYCDYPFDSLAKLDLGDLDAHIVMVPNPPFRPLGDFSLEGNRVGNREASRYTYSGIGVFHPRMLDSIAAGTKAPLAPLLRAAADAGRLGGEVYAGPWSDVGTPERLAELNREPNEPKAS